MWVLLNEWRKCREKLTKVKAERNLLYYDLSEIALKVCSCKTCVKVRTDLDSIKLNED